LQAVRGVSQVGIKGTVTDAYAEYLEMAMNAPIDFEVPELKLPRMAKEALERPEEIVEHESSSDDD
jgi:hypothetical protein